MINALVPKPVIYREGTYQKAQISRLSKDKKVVSINDIYSQQLVEIFEIENPNLLGSAGYSAKLISFIEDKNTATSGDWIFLPWSGILVHAVNEADYFALRTNRNKNLISRREQRKLYHSKVLVAGMSVGNIIASTLAYAGIAQEIYIADYDVVSTANLNRLRGGIADIGKPKTSLAAQQVYDINPYARVHIFGAGLTLGDLQNKDLAKVDIIFDEIDDFAMKVQLRQFAKQNSIPLIMLTSLDDNVLVDIERYDTQPTTKPFNGAIGKLAIETILAGTISAQDKIKYAIELVGQQYIPTQALASLPEIGKTLVGRPQLANAIMLDGSLATVCAKEILLGSNLKSGKYYVDMQALLGLQSATSSNKTRQGILNKIKEKINGK